MLIFWRALCAHSTWPAVGGPQNNVGSVRDVIATAPIESEGTFVTETTAPEQGTENSKPQNTGLSGLKLAQLQALASQLGITGALVPVEYGGPGLGVVDLVPVWRSLSHGWISLTGAVNPTGLATTLLVRHGTEAQRRRWLPGIAAGEVLASFSITEPQAGSDLSRMETTATTPWSTARARSSTGISCCRGNLPNAASIPRSTSAPRSAA